MGTMAKKINLLLVEVGISKQELAQRLGRQLYFSGYWKANLILDGFS